MIIWSPRKLEQQLATEALTTWEKTKYLVLAMVVSTISQPLIWVSPTVKVEHIELTAVIQIISTVVDLLIAYKGVKSCYKANNKENEFIDRFICLRVPWTVVFGVILTPFCITAIYALEKAFPDIIDLPTVFFYIISPMITLMYYRLLRSSFVRINNMQREPYSANG